MIARLKIPYTGNRLCSQGCGNAAVWLVSIPGSPQSRRWHCDYHAREAVEVSPVVVAQHEAVLRTTEWLFLEARRLGGIEYVDARRLRFTLYPIEAQETEDAHG